MRHEPLPWRLPAAVALPFCAPAALIAGMVPRPTNLISLVFALLACVASMHAYEFSVGEQPPESDSDLDFVPPRTVREDADAETFQQLSTREVRGGDVEADAFLPSARAAISLTHAQACPRGALKEANE